MMTMTPRLRKLALTAHVTSSVGWLGAVAGFLALAVAGLASNDEQRVRAAYLAMEVTAWFVIVPLSLASPLTGLAQSLGTAWGLFRHYWVVTKLVITIPASALLLVHMRPVGHLAAVVAETTLARGELAGLRVQLVADAGAALVALLVTTALSVYKPWGMTPYWRRKLHERSAVNHAADEPGPLSGTSGEAGAEPGGGSISGTPHWVYLFGAIVTVLALLFLILHLTGRGMGGHTPH